MDELGAHQMIGKRLLNKNWFQYAQVLGRCSRRKVTSFGVCGGFHMFQRSTGRNLRYTLRLQNPSYQSRQWLHPARIRAIHEQAINPTKPKDQ